MEDASDAETAVSHGSVVSEGHCVDFRSPEGHLVQHPDEESLSNLHKDMKRWEDVSITQSVMTSSNLILNRE